MHHSNEHRWPTCPLHLAAAVALLLGVLTTALHAQTDPRNPDAVALPEIGRMQGELKCVTAVLERFGRQIYPIGDVNGDSLADWVLTHRRCDTSFGGYAVIELLLYHGVRGGLPPTSAGMRIGPSEIDTDCSFLGAGDYDGDGYRDLAISTSIRSDSANIRLRASSIVVFWNDGLGRYSTSDTTHLSAPGERFGIMPLADYERWARVPLECDVDRDRAEDLVVATLGERVIDRTRRSAPSVIIYRGGRNGERWGRNGASRAAAWELWQRHFTRRVSVLDHDGDGNLDLVMYRDEDIIGRRGGLAVCYGRQGELPDTLAQSVDFIRVDGHDPKRCELIDLTGDRVPELIMSTGDTADGRSWRWLVYVGRRGQRLLEQYGSGNDAPRPGDSLWWGRPWTIIQTPHAINRSWNGPMHGVLDAGDIGLDGVGDFCVYNYPSVNCYNGGRFLDSYIDAWMLVPIAEGQDARIWVLGDVDGSRRQAIAVPLGDGGVRMYAASSRVPLSGQTVRLPEGSDVPLSAPTTAPRAPLPSLTLTPNPVSTTARVRWSSREPASVVLLDMAGRELRRWLLPAGEDELSIDVAGMPEGVFLISLRSADGTAVEPLILTR